MTATPPPDATAATRADALTDGSAVTVLDIKDLRVTFATDGGDVAAVAGVSLQVRTGEVLAIVGESGSGKTVTARSILGLLPETATTRGAIVLTHKDGSSSADITTLQGSALRQVRGRDAAMVFQEPSTALNPVFPVGWQIAEGLRAHGRISRKEARAKAIDIMTRVGIPDAKHRVDHYPHQFSGGQKQRIVIAQALVLDPGVIIADEPTTALDVTVQAEILDLLRRVRDEFGTSIVLITHNMGVVADLADSVAVMYQGVVVEQNDVRELFANPKHPYTQALLAAVPRIGDKAAARAAKHAVAHTAPRHVASAGGSAAGNSSAAGSLAGSSSSGGSPASGVGMASTALVTAKGLDITYPGRFRTPGFRAVKGVDLSLAPGEVLGLVGESGSGKTTIGRAIAGLTRVTGGSLDVLGVEMRGVRERTFRPVRQRIGFVFQDPASSFNPLMTIAECVAEPLVVHGKAADAKQARSKVDELLEAVQLPKAFGDRFPHELSGGQRQRASLARAIALDPELLIADEPTSALDVSVQAKVLELFVELQHSLGFACLFISHDLAVVDLVSDRIAVLHHGELVEQGTGAEVLGHPQQDYTQRLLASLPVPDPVEQAERRLRWEKLTAGTR